MGSSLGRSGLKERFSGRGEVLQKFPAMKTFLGCPNEYGKANQLGSLGVPSWSGGIARAGRFLW